MERNPYAASPACFLSTRSYEQCKVDVAYSNTNVKLIGISGGISYGALGMSHHSATGYCCNEFCSEYESISSERMISDGMSNERVIKR